MQKNITSIAKRQKLHQYIDIANNGDLDVHSKETRSYNMSRIKGKDTKVTYKQM